MKTSVQIIRRKDGFTLVEWENQGMPQRAWVTPDMLFEESGIQAIVNSPERGVPYGIPWARIVKMQATPTALEIELKRRGIWTFDDLQARPQDAIGALQAVYSIDYAHLMQAKENL